MISRREDAAPGIKGGVRARPPVGSRIPEMAGPLGDQLLRQGLEQLHDIDLAKAERRHVLGHASIGDAIELRGIEPSAAQILLQAEPRRRYLADGSDPHFHQLRK